MLDQDRPASRGRRRPDLVDDHRARTRVRRSPAPVVVDDPMPAGVIGAGAALDGRHVRRDRAVPARRRWPSAARSTVTDRRHRRPGVDGRTDRQQRHGGVAGPAADGRRRRSTTDVTRSADVSITKTLTTGGTAAGGPVAWTITVANAGPSTADASSSTMPLPAGRARADGDDIGRCVHGDGRHGDLPARHGRAPIAR